MPILGSGAAGEADRPGAQRVSHSDDTSHEKPPRPHGAIRGILKLIVGADSSRFAASRIASFALLALLLGGFALGGYGLAAWLSQYW